jgi:L-ascorbate metabolism protein UlaG (beta-lactamase superfamily)
MRIELRRLLGLLLCVQPFGCSAARILAETDVRPGAAASALQITWLGTAGVLLSDGETSLLIDPFVSRPGLLEVAIGAPLEPRIEQIAALVERLGPPRVGAVLVSHSHYDHSMDAPFFAWRTGALLVGSPSTINVGRGAGLSEERLRPVQPGDELTAGRFRVRFLESRHGPALFGRVPYPGEIEAPLRLPAAASSYRVGDTFSILIEHGATRLLHHGSAGCWPPALAGVRAETVLLGLAGRGDTAAYLRDVPAAVGARRIIPIHYDDFFEPLDRPLRFLPGVGFREFLRTARRTLPGARVETLPLGQSVPLLRRSAAPLPGP